MNKIIFAGKANCRNSNPKPCIYFSQKKELLLFAAISIVAAKIAAEFGEDWKNNVAYEAPRVGQLIVNGEPYWLQEFTFQQKGIFENAIKEVLKNV